MFKIPSEITLKKLQYFYVASEQLHFGKAAEILGISQPSLSTHIKEIEQTLDVELFNRHSRKIALTTSGEILKNESLRILEHVDTSLNKVMQSGRLERNTINMGVINAALTNDFMQLIEQFKKQFPCYYVNFIELPPSQQKVALNNREIDIGICRFADTTSIHPLSAISIVKENMYLAVASNSHFSSRKLISITELEGESFVIMNRERSASTDFILNFLQQEGVNPMITNEVVEPSTLLAFVASSQSISIVPESFSNIKFSNIKMIKLKESIPSDICAIFNHQIKNPILIEFVEFMSNAKKNR